MMAEDTPKNVSQKAADQRALRTFALWMGWAISALTVFAMMSRKANEPLAKV